jgi:hypothetical protein
MYFDNDPYEPRMTYINILYNLTPQKSDGSVCRQSDSLTKIKMKLHVMMAMVNLHIISSSCDAAIQ